MYHLLAGLYSECARTDQAQLTQKPTYTVLLVGLKGSGKTWILEKLRELYCNGSAPSSRLAPTVGQNGKCRSIHQVLDVPHKGIILRFWDLGGALSMRSLWDQYLPDAQLLVWVVDAPRWANNPVLDEGKYRVAMSNAFLHLVLSAAARDLPILVVLSQVDQLAMDSAAQTALQQDLHTFLLDQWAALVDTNPSAATLRPNWLLVAVSAATGAGMPSLLDTMHQHAVQFAKSNPTQ